MGTAGALAAKRATNTIPIVGAVTADPVADGLIASLAQPRGNVTGNTFLAPELGPKRLELLREVVPGVRSVAVLQHPGVYGERTMRDMLDGIRAAAVAIELQVLEARGPNEFDTAFSAMAKARAGALIIFPSPMFYVIGASLISPQSIGYRLCMCSGKLWRPGVSRATARIFLTSGVGRRLTLTRF